LYESLGLVGIEAMSCGVPVLGSNAFAVPEYIIPGKTGEMYRHKDKDDLLKSLMKMLGRLGTYETREVTLMKYGSKAVLKQYSVLFDNLK